MKRIDKMLKKARSICDSVKGLIFPGNEDGFMDALGVKKEKYAVMQSDGSIGYDFLSALNDIARGDWAEYERK